MRVDFVITELFVGGAERCLTELAAGLAETGDQVRVFSLASLPQGEQSLLVDHLTSAGIAVESAGADSAASVVAAYRRLRSWFSESVPDVSQTFLYHANVIGTLAAKSAGVQTRVGGIRVAEAKSVRCLIERSAVRRMQSVVCVSAGVERFARRRLGCPEQKSVVIPNGVDVTRFASAEAFRWAQIGWPDDAIVSLFVGRFHPQKGIRLLQEQIDVIAPPGTRRRMLLVGDGPLRDQIQAWAGSVGGDRVRVLPWQRDVAPLMRACRVLLLPSHYEGMPNVVLEAMAAARPVVCSRAEGSEELLSHAPEQQSFPVGDQQAMKHLIETFLLDEALSKQVGSENQSRVRRDFSVAAMIDAYRSHYRTLSGP